MKTFHDRRGFTLIELMIVVAIIGVCAAIAMPAMTSYKRREDTRQAAVSVSGMLTNARARAIASGRMTFVLLGEPGDGSVPFAPGQIAAMVTDDDGDNAVTAADTAVPIFPDPGMNPEISYYGLNGTPHSAAPLPPDDLSESEPDVALGAVGDGTTLPLSAALGVPVVAFSPQGAAVAADTPAEWGTGAGGIYITDNSDAVVAVLVLPLGSVKMQKFDTASGEWK
jgi:prepilin-type N-terminal cleavage/methylation domain-containing protein